MDRSDVLAALVSAQRDLALHLDTARTELISLPHQLADLQPMKTVMGRPARVQGAYDRQGTDAFGLAAPPFV